MKKQLAKPIQRDLLQYIPPIKNKPEIIYVVEGWEFRPGQNSVHHIKLVDNAGLLMSTIRGKLVCGGGGGGGIFFSSNIAIMHGSCNSVHFGITVKANNTKLLPLSENNSIFLKKTTTTTNYRSLLLLLLFLFFFWSTPVSRQTVLREMCVRIVASNTSI